MAKQTGIVRYSGNLGGISHYKMKGVAGDLAKIATGPSKDQIMNDPSFKRTRENNMEFGGSAKAGKSFRRGLASVIKKFSDSQVTGRVTKVFKAINLEGIGDRGKRNIDLSLNKEQINGFEFNKNISFAGVYTAPLTLTESVSRDESAMDITAFNPWDSIDAPAGATHFRIINGIATVSDYHYNDIERTYEAVEPTLDGLSAIKYTAYLPLDTAVVATTLTSTLAGAPVLTADVSVTNVIGIEFYQEVGGQYYLFASGNAMQVGKVF
jgi:hypothetical protein